MNPTQKIRLFARSSAWCLSLLAAGASSAADKAPGFKAGIKPILNAQCVFCHVAGAESGGLDLGGKAAYGNLVGAPSTESRLVRVAPGKPDESYLIHKLRGTQQAVGGSGERMPKTDPPRPMDPAQLDLITRWVEAGAPQ